MKVAVLGAGAWGTTLAQVLVENGHSVYLWSHEQRVVDTIKKSGCNSIYLPDISLPKELKATCNLQDVLEGAQFVVQAIPVFYMSTVLKQISPLITQGQLWVNASKGVEQDTLLLPTEIIEHAISVSSCAVLCGPSFAKDVAQKQYTIVECASTDRGVAQQVKNIFKNNYFFVELSADPVGLQWCAALKNVVTLGMGLLASSGYGDNTETLFFVAMLKEVEKIVLQMGGAAQTVYGYGGLGDLLLTARGSLSKNLKAGVMFAKGASLENIQKHFTCLPEGFNTLISVYQLLEKQKLSCPLFIALYEIFYNKKAHDHLIHALLEVVKD